MKEAEFSHWLMRQLGTNGHAQRVETSTGSGVPDINWCCEGIEMWIETKVGRPLLRPFQHAWITKRFENKGKVCVMMFLPQISSICLYTPPYKYRMYGKYIEITSDPNKIWAKEEFHFGLLLDHVGVM